MKFLFILFLPILSFSQSIDGISFEPTFPTEGDTITIYCDVTYGNTGCGLDSMSYEFFQNDSVAFRAFHCQGMATALCPTTDTFQIIIPIGVTGDIDFYYMPGFVTDDPNCTFPIFLNGDTIPYPSSVDSITIHIYPSHSANLKEYGVENIEFFPNPTNGVLHIRKPNKEKFDCIRILDRNGKEVKFIKNPDSTIEIEQLSEGIYLIQILRNHIVIQQSRIVKY
ncbi:MAG: T9SS type A sorting domain-containing protein [Crocinitomicaceae bacterium]|nr:T9SS type A sorting domain-containing protein [Crocinitomicaceae bacterium]